MKMNGMLAKVQTHEAWDSNFKVVDTLGGMKRLGEKVEILQKGGTVVGNDSHTAVNNMRSMFLQARKTAGTWRDNAFVVTVDEADTQFRSDNRTILLERAMDSFVYNTGMPPVLVVWVSGTIVPCIAKSITWGRRLTIDNVIFTKPSTTYL